MPDEATRRRLTTILAADVAGYSRLTAADEEATLRRLKEYREVVDRFIARHEGRIFGSAGDSVLAEFTSAVEAVRCAMAIQEELRVRNAALVEGHRMHFRIGINIGDVMVDGENLLGDGVNVAARLESVAEPGGICISGSTFEQVKSKLSVGFEDIGPQEVKNIPYPVPAFRIGHAPVALKTEGDRGGARQPWSRGSGGRRKAVIGAAIVLIAAGLGAGAWLLYPRGPKPLSAFPKDVSTADLRESDVKDFATGITVKGRRPDNVPFKFHLNPDMTADLEYDRTGEPNGVVYRESGSWWVENYRFCVRFQHFKHGQEACPRIVKHGTKLSATRPNGAPLDWTVTR